MRCADRADRPRLNPAAERSAQAPRRDLIQHRTELIDEQGRVRAAATRAIERMGECEAPSLARREFLNAAFEDRGIGQPAAREQRERGDEGRRPEVDDLGGFGEARRINGDRGVASGPELTSQMPQNR